MIKVKYSALSLVAIFLSLCYLYTFHQNYLLANQEKLKVRNNEGFWGHPDAEFDWCELNYQYSFYVAELFNTVTNGFYMLGSLVVWKKHQHVLVPLDWVFIVCLFTLGVLSAVFHATLRYLGQMLDEWSMILVSTSLVWCYVSLTMPPAKRMKQLYGPYCALLTVVSLMFFSTTDRSSLIHMTGRIGLTLTWMANFIFIAWRSYHQTAVGSNALKEVGFNAWVFALIAWIIDMFFCSQLHSIPFCPYPQLHAFAWHLPTALGTYVAFIGYLYLRLRGEIAWFWVIPYVIPPKSTPQNTEMEGLRS